MVTNCTGTFSTFLNFQILALLGNTFDDSEDICGVEAKIKYKQAKICLWTKSGHDEVKQRRIGSVRISLVLTLCREHFKEVLELTDKRVAFNLHEKEAHLRL
jgi:hypothetical protein